MPRIPLDRPKTALTFKKYIPITNRWSISSFSMHKKKRQNVQQKTPEIEFYQQNREFVSNKIRKIDYRNWLSALEKKQPWSHRLKMKKVFTNQLKLSFHLWICQFQQSAEQDFSELFVWYYCEFLMKLTQLPKDR